MPQGLTIIRQDDFSGGMWSTPTRERIPANGVADATNAFVDDTGGLHKRGGTTYLAPSGWPAALIQWMWQGTLTGGNRTLFATASNLYSLSGTTITNLGAYTGMAGGPNRPAVIGGMMYLPPSSTYDGTTFGVLATGTYVVSIANRIVAATGDTVKFSGPGTTTFAATDLWRIPGGVTITGLAALRDSAVVFTDQGTWVISNMALNLTDTAGNIQQRLDLYSPDMSLWGTGAAGVVGYQGGLIVPARDGVWLVRLGATSETGTPLQLLSGPIASLYQSYVTSGYRPGQAAMFRGHYFLPVINPLVPQLVTVLVCRVDLPTRPWTRFSIGYGFTPSQDGKTLLLAQDGPGFTSYALATAGFFGSGTADAGSSSITWSIVTRDYLTGPLTLNTIIKLRLGYHLIGGTLRISARDPASPSSITPSDSASGTGGTLSTFSWPIVKRAKMMRFTIFDGATPATGATISSLEKFVRQQSRR